MARKKVPQKIQATVLLESRRRCCICFGLGRDTSIKQGQIAHLDQNSSNNNESNLAFLCLEHHDQYDSSTKQSKNFTQLEVLKFKDELITSINQAFSSPVHFGEASTIKPNNVSGHYIRDIEYASADIKVKLLADGTYYIEGVALWGEGRETGPNIGDLEFIGELHNNTIVYTYSPSDQKSYKAHFYFFDGKLVIEEENIKGIFGLNVSFSGVYHQT